MRQRARQMDDILAGFVMPDEKEWGDLKGSAGKNYL